MHTLSSNTTFKSDIKHRKPIEVNIDLLYRVGDGFVQFSLFLISAALSKFDSWPL